MGRADLDDLIGEARREHVTVGGAHRLYGADAKFAGRADDGYYLSLQARPAGGRSGTRYDLSH